MKLNVRLSAIVEAVDTLDGMYVPGGDVSPDVAKHLGLDPDAGWRIVQIVTDHEPPDPTRRITATLLRAVDIRPKDRGAASGSVSEHGPVRITIDEPILLALMKAAQECAEDLQAEIDAKYPTRDKHRAVMRRWAADSTPCEAVRAAVHAVPENARRRLGP